MEQASYTMLMGPLTQKMQQTSLTRFGEMLFTKIQIVKPTNIPAQMLVVSDFNDALRNLFADSTFCSQIADIEENQESVAELMEQLKNPPAGYEEAYEALKEYYSAYLELTNMATNPSGSLQSYSSNFNEADSNA